MCDTYLVMVLDVTVIYITLGYNNYSPVVNVWRACNIIVDLQGLKLDICTSDLIPWTIYSTVITKYSIIALVAYVVLSLILRALKTLTAEL